MFGKQISCICFVHTVKESVYLWLTGKKESACFQQGSKKMGGHKKKVLAFNREAKNWVAIAYFQFVISAFILCTYAHH